MHVRGARNGQLKSPALPNPQKSGQSHLAAILEIHHEPNIRCCPNGQKEDNSRRRDECVRFSRNRGEAMGSSPLLFTYRSGPCLSEGGGGKGESLGDSPRRSRGALFGVAGLAPIVLTARIRSPELSMRERAWSRVSRHMRALLRCAHSEMTQARGARVQAIGRRTVRLSRRSCMMRVLSLYDSSLSVSSSAMASSNAALARAHASAGALLIS